DSLQDFALAKPWLYRIATNVCFDELKRRPKRLLAIDAGPAGDEPRPPFTRLDEPVWLEPMPDSWLDGVDQRDPQARYALKESVALAFVAALQCLSPGQRATLLLRDVIGLSAGETADALGTSVEAANSALFRARSAIEARFGGSEPADIAAHNEVDEAVLARYVRAFEDADLDALVALFHEEMRTTMPPIPSWVSGGAANERFYRAMFGKNSPGYFRTIATRANGQPALAFYRPASPGAAVYILVAIELVTTRDGAVIAVDHFMLPEVFPLFAVPRELTPG
ncbi:MAG TPA: RNA polymerase subunit sigma-70, partial [Polyangiales bacterium]|nr:RNA polymerase subunit sigma-70 [Polyangiales bacterium]